MDRALLVSTFVSIFLAELGDKTQLAAFSLSAGGQGRLSVFLGASLALVCSTALAVLAGDVVGRFIPPIWVKRAAGALFVVMGVMLLATREGAPADNAPSAPPEQGQQG